MDSGCTMDILGDRENDLRTLPLCRRILAQTGHVLAACNQSTHEVKAEMRYEMGRPNKLSLRLSTCFERKV